MFSRTRAIFWIYFFENFFIYSSCGWHLLQKGSQKSMIWVKKTPVLASSISAPNNHVHSAISQFQPVLVDANSSQPISTTFQSHSWSRDIVLSALEMVRLLQQAWDRSQVGPWFYNVLLLQQQHSFLSLHRVSNQNK